MAEAVDTTARREDIGKFDLPTYYGLGPNSGFVIHFHFNAPHTGNLESVRGDWIGLFPCGWRSLQDFIQKHSVFPGVTSRDATLVKLQFYTPHDCQPASDSWYQFVYVSSAGMVKANSDGVNFGYDPSESPSSSQPASYCEHGYTDEPDACQYPYGLLQHNEHSMSAPVNAREELGLSAFDKLLKSVDAMKIDAVNAKLAYQKVIRDQEEAARAQESQEATIKVQQEFNRLQHLFEESEVEKRRLEQEVDSLQGQVIKLQRTVDALRGYIPEGGRESNAENVSSLMSTGECPSLVNADDRSSNLLLPTPDVAVLSHQNHRIHEREQDNPPVMTNIDTQFEHITHSQLGRVVCSQSEPPENGPQEHHRELLEDRTSVTHQCGQALREAFLDEKQ